jgi:hypothetical protein
MLNGAGDASGVFVRKRILPFIVIALFCPALNEKPKNNINHERHKNTRTIRSIAFRGK